MYSLVSCCSQFFILKSLCNQWLTWLLVEDTGNPVMGASSANGGMSSATRHILYASTASIPGGHVLSKP
ncbi:hypothetical protein BN1723_001556 [Verticillium longisporum]|uniref:Uncharacterized protein n=1 Tax=Verticillium longisporum TaxID=100787 RepID=A0A0G4KFD5_VERLO|nr:hypothetical protein BN1723_001556 [Verticillium longisporum]